MSVDSGIGAEDLANTHHLIDETIRLRERAILEGCDVGSAVELRVLQVIILLLQARLNAIDAGELKTPKPIGNTSVNTCDDAVTDKMIEAGVERLNHHYSDKRLSFTKTAVSDIYRAMREAQWIIGLRRKK